MSEAEPKQDDVAERALEVAKETEEAYQAQKEQQHELLEAVAEEDGAPLLETRCNIYGVTVPVSGRLTGEFVERVEALDAEAKRRADGESDDTGVSDIIAELCEILDGLIDDDELTTEGLYQQYRQEGVGPVRTIIDEVMDALKDEQERVEGTADGFRGES